MGASGMVAELSTPAAAAEVEPNQGARGTNSSYMGTANPDHWRNWLTEAGVTYHAVGDGGPAFVTWPIDFAAGPVTSALYRIDANGASSAYGIPAGATLDFSLITEPWSPATPDSNQFGPDHGTTLGVDRVQVVAPGGDMDADITPLLQAWQASPTAYYGVRFAVTRGADRGGVYAPNDTADSTGITANLIMAQSTPEPAALSLLSLAALLGLRRRRPPSSG
jgi:MYXO-CTERM domain-containing protein